MNDKGQIVIGIDYDGVITDSLAITKHINHIYRMNLRPWEITDYDLNKVYGLEIDWTDKPYHNLTLGQLHKYAPWQQYAVEVIDYLTACPHVDLYIISSRGKEGAEASVSMFDRQLGNIPNLIFTGNEDDKIAGALKCGCDLFIDDNPKTLEALAVSGINAVKYSQPYNKDTHYLFGTVNSWMNIIDIVEYYYDKYIKE